MVECGLRGTVATSVVERRVRNAAPASHMLLCAAQQLGNLRGKVAVSLQNLHQAMLSKMGVLYATWPVLPRGVVH